MVTSIFGVALLLGYFQTEVSGSFETCGPVPILKHGWISDGESHYGSERTLRCKPGFGLTASKIVRCRGDGSWEVFAKCSKVKSKIELVQAAMTNSTVKIEKLLNAGVDVDSREPLKNNTCLHWAVWNNLYDSAVLLLQRGAQVDLKNANGNTPLNWAAWIGNVSMTKLLIDNGADVNATNNAGRSVIKTAAMNNHTDIIALLMEYGASLLIEKFNMVELVEAAQAKDSIAIGKLLDRGADPNSRDPKENNTCLHWAIWNDLYDAAKLLIDRGAQVNARNNFGNTPLHWIAWTGNATMGKLLLDSGADANARNSEGTTPLMRAVVEKHVEVVALLRHYGADPGATNDDGQTVFDFVLKSEGPDYDEVVAALKGNRHD